MSFPVSHSSLPSVAMQIVQLCMYSGKQSYNPKDFVFISNTFEGNNWFLKCCSIILLPPPTKYITVAMILKQKSAVRVMFSLNEFGVS